jgi:hypothetical protein
MYFHYTSYPFKLIRFLLEENITEDFHMPCSLSDNNPPAQLFNTLSRESLAGVGVTAFGTMPG